MTTKSVTVNGITGRPKSLSAIFNVVPWDVTYRRMHKWNWPAEKALLTPIGAIRVGKACEFCNTRLENNAHTCSQCLKQTYAGVAAELRKSLK